MNKHTFKFYGNDKYLKTMTIFAETIERAYKKADDILRTNKKYDDWEYIPNHLH